MPYFIISGKPNCPHFMHAIHVAEYLHERLPSFVYKKVEKQATEWADYIHKLNKLNSWYITESPLIWKEINIWGGKKHLIGGLSEFWEYVFCYYGLESIISKEDLKKLAADNFQFFLQREKAEKENETNVRVITILGASAPQTPLLIDSLLKIRGLEKAEGMNFQLYDDPRKRIEKEHGFLAHFNNLSVYKKRNIVTICDTEEEALKGSDIVIHVGDFRRETHEDEQIWLKRCFISMQHIAGIINKRAKRHCIVIMNNHGPVCFLATCLVEMCTKLKPYNIVAVTADEGLSVTNVVSEVSGVPIEKLSAPPVWGFVGLNSFVDEKNAVIKADVYRPHERSLTAPIGSTLALGTVQTELRLLTNLMTDHEEIRNAINERHAKINVTLNRPPILAKVRAVTSLLDLWFAELYSDAIISLGVCSNGSFGITPGIVFSQPVKLDERGKWVPFDKFPILNDFTKSQIQECLAHASEVIEQFGMGKSDDNPPADLVSMITDISSTQGDEDSELIVDDDDTIVAEDEVGTDETVGQDKIEESKVAKGEEGINKGDEMNEDEDIRRREDKGKNTIDEQRGTNFYSEGMETDAVERKIDVKRE